MRYVDEDVYPWSDALDTVDEYGGILCTRVTEQLEGSAHATGPNGAAARAIGCNHAK